MQGTGRAEIADGPCLWVVIPSLMLPMDTLSFCCTPPTLVWPHFSAGQAPGSLSPVRSLCPIQVAPIVVPSIFCILQHPHGDMGYLCLLVCFMHWGWEHCHPNPRPREAVLMPFLLLKHIPPPPPRAPEHPPGHISDTQMPASFLWGAMTLGVHFCLALSAPVHHTVSPRSSWRIQELMGKEESKRCLGLGWCPHPAVPLADCVALQPACR